MKLSRRDFVHAGCTAVVATLAFSPLARAWTHGKQTGVTNWTVGAVGGGGFVTDIDIASDGSTKVLGNDTYGFWVWDASLSPPQWAQGLDNSRLTSSPFVLGGLVAGEVEPMNGYAVAIAPSDPQRIYAVIPAPSTLPNAVYTGSLWKSTNGGRTFSITGVTGLTISGAGSKRLAGRRLKVDPANADVVYIGVDSGAVIRTLDAGSTSATVSSVLAGQPCIEIDPTSGTTVVSGVTVTKGVYISAFSGAVTGTYESLDGAATFNATTGGPNLTLHNVMSADGVLYATDASNSATNAWRYVTPTSTSGLTAGVWVNFNFATNNLVAPTGGNYWQSMAPDPAHAGRIVFLDNSGRLATSTTYGTMFFTYVASGAPSRASLTSSTIPWLAATQNVSLTAGNIKFDPGQSNVLIFTFGTGVGTFSPIYSNTTLGPAYADYTLNQNGLIVDDMVFPPGGQLNLFCQDRVQVYCPGLTTFPTTNWAPLGATSSIKHSLSGDYSKSDPTFLVLGCSDTKIYKSTDGGQNWAKTAGDPVSSAFPIVAIGFGTGNAVNAICAGVSGTPQYTLDSGATWATSTLVGGGAMPTTWGTGLGAQKPFVADDTTPGVFYLRGLNGFYKSVDGGATYTLQSSYTGKLGLFSRLAQVTGHTDHLFFSNGNYTTVTSHPQTSYPLQRTTDGGATLVSVASIDEAWQVCFGPPAPGKTLPTVYCSGYLHNDPNGVKPRILRSIDLTLTATDPMTWVDISQGLTNCDRITCLIAHPTEYGTVYAGSHGYACGRIG